jgi:poly(3-hydroxybutyrate) depolymerase
MLVALAGAAGSPQAARAAAMTLRDQWGALADAGASALVVVPVAGGSQGGWIVPDFDGGGPSDYDVVAAAMADVEAAYNVERTRETAWGFSAGGDILHDLAINGWSGIDADRLAGYAVIGAALSLCPDYDFAPTCDPAQAARRIPLDIHLGTDDPVAADPYDGDGDAARFLAAGWIDGVTLFQTRYAGGHAYTPTELAQAWSNLCPRAVVP